MFKTISVSCYFLSSNLDPKQFNIMGPVDCNIQNNSKSILNFSWKWVRETKRTNRKETYKNKIAKIKMNGCSFSNLTRKNFVLYFSTKKRMRRNEKKNLFIVNGNFFRNIKKCIIHRRSLFTIHTRYVHKFMDRLGYLWNEDQYFALFG